MENISNIAWGQGKAKEVLTKEKDAVTKAWGKAKGTAPMPEKDADVKLFKMGIALGRRLQMEDVCEGLFRD